MKQMNYLLLVFMVLLLSPALYANTPAEVNAKDFGFNELDSTAALQGAINTGAKKVIVPNMGKPWIVARTINLVSNQEIFFEPGVEVLAKKGEFKGRGDSLVLASNKENIILRGYGATLRMRKKDYQGPEYDPAEWRMGLSIRSCRNVQVLGLTIADSGGDGIYLGTVAGVTPSYNRDIIIRDVVCDNNHRQGMSVISAKNLLVENSAFNNTSGTAPMAGIDFEPNNPGEYLSNIVVRNCFFENNEKLGIHLWSKYLDQTSEDISIRIENCHVKGTEIGINIGSVYTNGPKGLIEFVNCTVEETQFAGIRLHNKAKSSARVVFNSCIVEDAASRLQAPIFFDLTDTTLSKCQGGVDFIDCTVKQNSAKPFLVINERLTKLGIYNINGNITVQSPHPAQVELGATHPDDFNLTFITKPMERKVNFVPRMVLASAANEHMAVRREGTYLLYAKLGDEVTVDAVCKKMGSNNDSLQLSIISPTNEVVYQGEIVADGKEQIVFKANETGIYYINGYANRNAIEIKVSNPLGLETTASFNNLLWPQGHLYFWLPEGLVKTEIKVEGDGIREQVKATLIDSNGKVVEEKDNISGLTPHTFIIDLGQPSKGEVWSLRLDKPGNKNVAHEDVWVGFNTADIPAVSFSPEIVFEVSK